MPANRHPATADEESRYLALLNALSELDHDFQERNVPAEACHMLGQLTELCRSDYRERFSR